MLKGDFSFQNGSRLLRVIGYLKIHKAVLK